MALPHTILAALSISDHSGYDLLKRFADSDGCFWRATQQQIYRELAKLESQDLITPEIIPQEGKPDKKLYTITDAGRELLQTWIAEPSTPTPVREELLVKVLASHLVEPEIVMNELTRRQELHQAQLEIYLEIQEKYGPDLDKLPLEEQCRYMTLRRGIRYQQSWVEWCDEVMDWLGKQTSKSRDAVSNRTK